MSTTESGNRFKFTESNIPKRCLPPGPGEMTKNGKPLRDRRYWDTEVRGFGIIARGDNASFILQRDLKGKSTKVTIGRVGTWTVFQARQRARELAVQMDKGINPNEEKRQAKARTITVGEALALHAEDMRRRDCAPLSVEFVEDDILKYLPDWADCPLVELTKSDCVERHKKLSVERGPAIANRVMKMFGAAYRGAALMHAHLGETPPTTSIRWNPIRRRRAPIPWEELPTWWAKVLAIHNPVRRDLQLLMLFTGLRSHDAKTIRWEHVDMVRKTLHRPKPKGGVDRAFTIPLAEVALAILRRRRRENDVLFSGSEWVFPTRLRNGSLSHVVEAKELRAAKTEANKDTKVAVLPTPHRLRDTFITAAHECELKDLNIKALVNHMLPGGDVTQGYIRPDVEHLRACVEKVAGFLLGKAGEQGYASEATARP